MFTSEFRKMSQDLSFQKYATEGFYDELFDESGSSRPEAKMLVDSIRGLAPGELLRRQAAIDRAMMRMGITFTVYGDERGTEKIWPFDIIPRIVGAAEWRVVEQGLKQRIKALNLFINDIYHDQQILNDGIIPRELLEGADSFRKQCIGLNPPRGVWIHITGTDLIRHSDRDPSLHFGLNVGMDEMNGTSNM